MSLRSPRGWRSANCGSSRAHSRGYLGRAGRRSPVAQASQHIRRDPQRELGARDRDVSRASRSWIRGSDGRLNNDELQVQPVRKSQVFFFCAAGHPLAGRKRLALEDLLEYPWAGPLRNAIGPRFPRTIDHLRSSAPIAVVFIRAPSSGLSPPPSRSSWAGMC